MFLEGKIKSYNADRGFGFIQQNEQVKDLFFHVTDIPSRHIELKLGEKVKYLISEDQGNFKAVNIVRLDLKQQQATEQALQSTIVEDHSREPISASPRYEVASVSPLSKIISFVGVIIIVVLAVIVYGKYQSYREQKQLHAQQLMQQQQQIVEEQRKAQGDLPDQVLSEQGLHNLHGTGTSELRRDVVDVTPKSTQAVQQAAPAKFSCDGRTHCSQMRSYEEAVFFNNNCPNTKMDGNNDGEPCERQFKNR